MAKPRLNKSQLQKLARNYRSTKKYPLLATIAEYEYLQSQWAKIERQLKHPDNDISLENIIGLTIGLWQASNGFYLTSRQVFGKLKK